MTGGLWEFSGADTVEEHARVWGEIETRAESAQWALAAIAASLITKYGESEVCRFAEIVHRSPQYIWKMARTYRLTVEKSLYSENLSFHHHAEAIRHPDPFTALAIAQTENLSANELSEWVSQQNKETAKKPRRNRVARESAFVKFLERVDNTIVKDFMATCPDAEWGRRVFRGWREEITWELSQIDQRDRLHRVLDAIAAGAKTLAEIHSKTGLLLRQVDRVVSKLVSDGLYEWIRQGGEPAFTKGSRPMILHKVGEPYFT